MNGKEPKGIQLCEIYFVVFFCKTHLIHFNGITLTETRKYSNFYLSMLFFIKSQVAHRDSQFQTIKDLLFIQFNFSIQRVTFSNTKWKNTTFIINSIFNKNLNAMKSGNCIDLQSVLIDIVSRCTASTRLLWTRAVEGAEKSLIEANV